MKKQKYLALANFLSYLALFLTFIGLAIYMFVTLQTSDANGWEGFGLALGGVLIIVICLIAAAAVVIPTILRGISIGVRKLVFSILCLPFDLCYVAFGIAMLIGQVTQGNAELSVYGWLLYILVMTVGAFAVNVVSVVFFAVDKRKTKIMLAQAEQIPTE